MQRMTALFALTLVASLAAWCQDRPQNPPVTKPINDLAWLVGGVWTADASKLGPEVERIETRYDWSDNHAFVRFNTHFVMKEGTLKNYDGQFFWNPEKGSLEMWYMDAHNGITQGPVTVEGDVLRFVFRGNDFDGKPADLRVLVTRKTKDQYTWQLEEKAQEGWKPLARLEYVRLS